MPPSKHTGNAGSHLETVDDVKDTRENETHDTRDLFVCGSLAQGYTVTVLNSAQKLRDQSTISRRDANEQRRTVLLSKTIDPGCDVVEWWFAE